MLALLHTPHSVPPRSSVIALSQDYSRLTPLGFVLKSDAFFTNSFNFNHEQTMISLSEVSGRQRDGRSDHSFHKDQLLVSACMSILSVHKKTFNGLI